MAILIDGQTYSDLTDYANSSYATVRVSTDIDENLTFRNNSITSAQTAGYLLDAGDEVPASTNNNLDGMIITGNRFRWTATPGTPSTHGMFMGYNINMVVKYNYMDGVPYNILFKSGSDTGVNMTNTTGGASYNIVKNPKMGVRSKGQNGVKVYNNTFYNSYSSGTLIYIDGNHDRPAYSSPLGTRIKNNIFYSVYNIPFFYIENGCLADFECDYNVYYCQNSTNNYPSFNVGGTSYTWTAWRALGYDTHSVVINPNFNNTTDFVPATRLNYGTDLGTEFNTGLSTTATWVVGTSPATAVQNGTWQVGARVYASTSAAIPTVTTTSISSITSTTASSGGNVTSDGGASVTARGVCWSTSSGPTVSLTTKTSNGTGTGTFTSSITGLSANTTYYVRAYATNSTGTAYGSQITFTTSVALPTVTTTTISSITTTTASSGGNVTSAGGGTITARGVCWSTSSSPTIANSRTTNGTGTGTFTSSITGLSANTTYYVRAYATNSAGTAYGSQVSFSTLASTTNVYYIDVNGVDDPARNGLSNAQAWKTLSYAIGRVTTAGSVIHVNPGVYPAISIVMPLSSGVSIEGEGRTITTIPLTHTTANVPALNLETPNGWETDASGNQHISGIKFTGNLVGSRAISVKYRSNVHIYDCEFVNFIDGAVYFVGEPYSNWTTDNPYVEVNHDKNRIPFNDSFCTGNKFYNNIVTNCARYVIEDHHTGGLSIGTQDGIEIYGNIMDNSLRGGYGIKFYDEGFNKNLNIHDNDITTHAWTSGWRYEFAIEIWWSLGGDRIYDNRLRGAIDIGACVDLYSVGYGMLIYNNNIGRDATPNSLIERAILFEGKVEYVSVYNNYIHHVATAFYMPRKGLTDVNKTMLPGGYSGSDRLFHINIYSNLCVNLGQNAGDSQTWGVYFNPQGEVRDQSENQHIYIQHNTFMVDPALTRTTRYGMMLPNVDEMSYIYYENNIIIGFTSAGIVGELARTKVQNVYIRNNLLYNNGNSNVPLYTGGFQTAGVTYVEGPKSDPLFKGGSPYSYELSSTASPAYHAGRDLTISTDYAGNAFHATTPSIGAYEYVGTSGTPILTTASISSINITTATGGGNITSDGGSSVTARGVCWATTQNPTTANSRTTDGIGTGAFTSSITGLTTNTTYYVRAYATNAVGTSYGSQVSFTTDRLAAVTTTSASSITSTTAASGGNVTSDGGASITAKGVCWATTQNPTTANSTTNNGTGTGVFTSNITGLTENTTYYVRAYATNAVGTSYGSQISFTTSSTLPLTLTDDIVAYWKFDETMGYVALDETPNNHDISTNAAVTIGKINSARSFTGTSYAMTPHHADFTPSGGSQMTISMWVYLNQMASAYGYDEVFYRVGNTISPSSPILIKLESADVADRLYWLAVNSSGTAYYTYADAAWTMSTWYHLVFVCQGNGLPGKIYRNGVDITSYGAPFTGTFYQANENVFIGDSNMVGGQSANCRIDEVGVWKRALTESEITSLYSSGTGLSYPFSETPDVTIPTLNTIIVSSITQTSATSGGNNILDGGASIIAKGVCWSINENPTILNSKTTDGIGTTSFLSNLTNLIAGTLYYVRAYATNSAGTGYGNQVSFTTLMPTVQDPSLKNGLMGYWKLDELTGNALDSYGSIHGIINGVIQGVTGKINRAYTFNAAQNTSVEFGSACRPTTGLSIAGWIKPSSQINDWAGVVTNLISYGAGDQNGYSVFVIDTSQLVFELFNRTNYTQVYSDTLVTPNAWHFIACTWDSQNAKIYIDSSIADVVVPRTTSIAYDPTSILRFGSHSSPYDYNGDMDEIGIWNRALTVNELSQLYNNGTGLSYPFEDGPIPTENIYYVSTSGNDSNNGISEATPWRTIAKVNATSFVAGSQILFKRGDTWSGEVLTPATSGTSGNNIVYGAYGVGDDPIINGFTTITGWTNYGGGIYSKTISTQSTPNILLFNGVNQPLGRYPKTGYLFADTVTSTSLTDSNLPSSPDYDGAQMAKRTAQWVTERRTVTHTNQTLSFSSTTYNYGTAGGYILQNNINTLTQLGDWCYTSGVLYVYFGANAPTNYTVQIPTQDTLLSLSSKNYITIENITLQGSNQYAIYMSNADNVTIQNNTIQYHGYYGLYDTGNSDYLTINNNIFTHCNDMAMRSLYEAATHYTITNNDISYIGYIFGMGGSSDHSYSGIEFCGDYGLISYNTIEHCGYDGIIFGGQDTEVSYNFINYPCLNKADGGGIYTYRDYNTGKVVKYNIILNSYGNIESWNVTPLDYSANGIYNDGSYTTIYTHNICAHNNGSGLFINACRNITANYNTLYDNTYQMQVLSQNTDIGYAEGHIINNNILFVKTWNNDWIQGGFKLVLIGSTTFNDFGIQNYNYFIKPIFNDDYIDVWPNAYDWQTIPLYHQKYNLTEWRAVSPHDDNSYTTPRTITDEETELHFIYNNTTSNKSYILSAAMVDATNTSYSGTITLEPFTSLVLIGSGNVDEQTTNVFYVSTTGNDSNPGTFDQPWLTWQKAFSEVEAGDTVYIRGGVYYPTGTLLSGEYCGAVRYNGYGTQLDPIRIYAYPTDVSLGNYPILDGTNMNQDTIHYGIKLENCSYWYLKGLIVRNFGEYYNGSTYKASHAYGIYSANNITVEQCVAYNTGNGFTAQDTTQLYFDNCDAYQNSDHSNNISLGNGFRSACDATQTVYYEGCRAWLNSNNGYDNYGSDGYVYYNNCWAFENGNYDGAIGNGSGFRTGASYNTKETGVQRMLTNCISWNNTGYGYNESQDSYTSIEHNIYNCVSYSNNSSGFNFSYSGAATDIIKNNVSYDETLGTFGTNDVSRNSWQVTTLTAADFITLLDTGVKGVRQSNGDLPLVNFMKLATSSELIWAGTDVDLTYDAIGNEWHVPPSIGVYEYDGSLNVPVLTTTAISSITTTTASGGGNVTSDGGAAVIQRGICWATTQNPTITNFFTNNGTGTGSFTSSLTGLTPATTYYVRAYATNNVGTSYGTQVSFTTTSNITPPIVTSPAISNITNNSATATSNVTSAGNGTVTARGVCWATTSSPTIAGSHTTDGTGIGSFTSSMTDLLSGTTYYVRSYATNSAGTTYSTQVSFTTIAGGTSYYISTSGNDSNNGTSEATPWRTIAKVNATSFAAGSFVYFKRGDVWTNEVLTPATSGTSGSKITFGAYGTGENPVISGLTTITGWTNEGGGIYSKTMSVESSPNMVTVNGVNTPMGKYPDADNWLTIDSHTGGTSITDAALPSSPNWSGAEAVIRKNNWIIDRCHITSHVNQTLNIDNPSDYPWDGYSIVGNPYFIQNSLSTLTTFGEWYYGGGKFYMYFGTTDPTTVTVKVSSKNQTANITNRNYLTFSDITFEGANQSGIYIEGSDYITIQNSTIRFCGDAGIDGYHSEGSTSLGFVVNNVYIHDVQNQGIILGSQFDGALIQNCTVNNIGLLPGHNFSADGQNNGIKVYGHNHIVEYNRLTNLGYNAIDFGGNNVKVRYNYINGFGLVKDDVGGIYTTCFTTLWVGREIYGNIVMNGLGAFFGDSESTKGIYADQREANLAIYNNVVYNCGVGILLHNAHECTVTNNLVYGCTASQLWTQHDSSWPDDPTRNLTITGNKFLAIGPYSATENNYAYRWHSILGVDDNYLFGTADNNVVCRFLGEEVYPFYLIKLSGADWSGPHLTFAQWKTNSGEDTNSTGNLGGTVTSTSQLHFIYNDTKSNKTYTLSASMKDVSNTTYAAGNITLTPFTGLVLIGTGTVVDNTVVGVPTVSVTSISNITSSTASSGGNVISDGGSSVTARGVCWSTSQNPTIALATKTSDGTGTGSFTSSITGLSVNTTYYVRAYATNSSGTGYSSQTSFTTVSVPVVTTIYVSDISTFSVVSGGNVTSDGGASVTARGVCWNTSSNPTILNNKTVNGTGTGSFVSNVFNLEPSTHYYIRAYATNNAGTGYGNLLEFDTLKVTGTSLLSGLMGYWKLDETTGQVLDALGVLNGTNFGATRPASGKLGTSYAFNAAENDYVDLGKVCKPTTGITLASWIYPSTQLNDYAGFINNNKYYSPTSQNGYNLFIDSSKLLFELFNETVINAVYSNTIITPNTWHFVVCSWDGNTVNVYVDSNFPDASQARTTSIGYDADSSLRFGSHSQNYDYNGRLDEVGIWNRALTSNELYTLYNSGIGLTYPFGEQVVTSIPTVTTSAVSNIGSYGATCGGNVTDDGSLAVTSRGLCWSTSPTPTIANYTTNNGTGEGIFTGSLTGLLASTNYYVRAYATNSLGTAYGAIQTFTTLAAPDVSTSKIVNHNCTVLSNIPLQYIEAAKRNLYIAYQHTSHGSQLITGMTALNTWKGGGTYAWNETGSGGALHLDDYFSSGDLGNPDFVTWAGLTRTYLDTNPSCNTMIWSWCGEVSDATEANINTYLSLMNQLELDYPSVKFVYMTGHTDGTGVAGNLNVRNEQIRNYCISNNKWLYDFADIESYDPDGNYYLNKAVNDNCDYDSNNDGTRDRNWALDWQSTHIENVDWFMCYPAHSQALNGNLKAYAAWCLWAKLAGWGGTPVSVPTVYTGTGTDITSSSVIGSGSITNDGGGTILEKGLCWSTSINPTILNSHLSSSSTSNSFTISITGLTASTTYYVRAYATNSAGTGYGDNYQFTTLSSIPDPILTTYYVSPTGIDSTLRNGGVGQEWASLSYACSRVTTSGNLIRVMSGNYVDNNLCSLAPGVSIIGYGPTAPNIVTRYAGSYSYGYIRLYSSSLTNGNQSISYINIDGSALTASRGITVMHRNNVTINNCNIKDFDVNGIIFNHSSSIATYASNNIVRDCSILNSCKYVSGVGGNGSVEIEKQQNFEFYNNTVRHDQRPTYTNGNGFKTIGYINGLKIHDNIFYGDVNSNKDNADSYDFCIELWGTTKSGIEIYNNIIYNNEIDIAGGNTTKGTHEYSVYVHDNSIGCTSQLTYNKIGLIIEQDINTELSDVIIKNNHFKNLSNCIKFYPTLNSVFNNIKIQCNIFENIGRNATGWTNSWGISYGISSGPPFTTTNWFIENNTFVATTIAGGSESAAVKLWNVSGSIVNNIYIRNNIITNFEGYPVYSDVTGALSNFYFTHNDVYNCGNPIYLVVTPTGSDVITGNVTGDPRFTSSTDFHISSTLSAAYRSGTNVNILTDFDGVAWNIPYPSMGAYEYTAGGTTTIPVVTTSTITNINTTTATGGGNVVSNGNLILTERGVCWSTSSNPTISNSRTSNGTDLGPFTSYLVNLNPSTHYYARAYATNSLGTGYGSVVEFNTLLNSSIPVVSTSTITNINMTTAIGGGNVTHDGSLFVSSRGICWNISPSPTTANSYTISGSGTGSFTSYLTTLNPSTLYYVRAYATNSIGTAYGSDVSFNTLPNVSVPIVTTTSITDISVYTATGGGNVTHDGSLAVVSRGICWSTSINPTVINSSTSNGTGEGTFTSYLTNLSPSTNYYVRAFAANSAGIGYGSSVQFNTLQIKSLPTVVTNIISDVSIRSATGGGNVTHDGSTNVTARGICWSIYPGPTLSNSITNNGTGKGTYVSYLTNLNPSTYYYVRAYATNEIGTAYGNTVTFTTLLNSSLPTVTTSPITNVTIATATGGGNVTLDGSLAVTARGVCWSTSQNPTVINASTNNGTGKGIFTSNIIGLNSSTNYYVRAYAVNSLGVAYGANVSFTTPIEYTIPYVITTGISHISVHNARCSGNVIFNGNSTVTTRGFCWNKLGNPTLSDASLICSSGDGYFTCTLTSLDASTTYYVRAYAINSTGVAYGSDISFNTLKQGPKMIKIDDKYLKSGDDYLLSNSLDI